MAGSGNVDALLALLVQGRPAYFDAGGRTPPLRATETGNARTAQLLAGDKADLERRTKSGNTA